MKQKIKEVREKFLSNNQIEDIRQNITTVVEERLKFLSTKQTKAFEDLETSTKNLDALLQEQILRAEAQKSDLEESSISQLNKFNDALQDDINQIRTEQQRITESSKILEQQIKKDVSNEMIAVNKSMDETHSKIQADNKKTTEDLVALRETIKNETTAKTEEFEKSNKSELDRIAQKEKDIKLLLDKKLIEFDETKETLLKEAKKEIQSHTALIETQIKSFSDEQKTLFEKFEKEQKSVGEIIDDRLKEFRIAQKAAFEELEAALNLLERHQDDTINKFKDNKSKNIVYNYDTVDPSLLTNRGSISNSNEDKQDAEPISDLTVEDLQKANEKKSKKTNYRKLLFFSGLFIMVWLLLVNFAGLKLENIIS